MVRLCGAVSTVPPTVVLSWSPCPVLLPHSPPGLSLSAYTMAKFGMSMCVLGMAEELRPQGIKVNALWPKTGVCIYVWVVCVCTCV